LIITVIVLLIRQLTLSNFNEVDNKNLPSIVLITEHFIHKDINRYSEIVKSIDSNDKNSLISKIYLLNENKNDTFKGSDKIINVPTNKRTTFKEAFEFANKLPNGTIAIISNNDISFDETLNKLYDVNLDNTVICLGRRHYNNDNKFEFFIKYGGSQDSWIFKTPIRVPEESNFYFGTDGCDHHIAYLLKQEGYDLINLAYDIKARHHHKSKVRNWVKKSSNYKKLLIKPVKMEII
jgi:hypothetical protein